MKRILGLDLGTNSIGWALVGLDLKRKFGEIIGNGVRIIPMDKGVMDKFGSGQSISQTANRTGFRGTRRLYQRDTLRRERLHRVLNLLGFLPRHYTNSIDFEKYLGQFKKGKEIKLNYLPKPKGIKDEFLFKETFLAMVADFKKSAPELFHTKTNGEEAKIPYDWTIYYLRKKALSQKISKEELAWLLLNFNQKRGYYQLRGEEEEIVGKKEEFYQLKVVRIETSEDKNAKGIWYNVHLENGFIYRRQSKDSLDNWLHKIKEFIVTTQLEKDGSVKTDKEGNVKRSFRAVDSEKDWIAIKKKTEQDIKQSNKTVGAFVYDTLLKNPSQKINGKLIKTIERKYYKEELAKILHTQIQYHSELTDKLLYKACVKELYANNLAHQNNILNKAETEMFRYLFMDDIIFYQRPLKSKKSSIANCAYEVKNYIRNGEKVEEGFKVISKSHPYFIEFRLWQFIHNLKIYKVEEKTEVDVTKNFFSIEEDITDLYDFLNTIKEVEQKHIINYLVSLKKITKAEKNNYRWNYVEDKKYPSNPTRSQMLSRFRKVDGLLDAASFFTKEKELHLWHIIYSVKDKQEFEQALTTFAKKNNLDENTFVAAFLKHPPFASDYGAYSEKAIKKLLPLMRRGKYWNEANISNDTKEFIANVYERIHHLKTNKVDDEKLKEAIELVSDDEVPKQFVKSFLKHSLENPLTGLNTYQACYAVYQKWSEASVITQWQKPADVDMYLENFKQHSLRNPIVEKVVLETLRTVSDIWKHHLKKDKDFKFDEIHLELGRDIKNSSDKRKRISERQSKNENTNTRIKLLLEELHKDGARSYSPSHQEILKIYEEGISENPNVSYSDVKEEEIEKIKKNAKPNSSDISKYKLWLEQGYVSPYTGKTISLSKLFTHEYEIEHIIPQSRFFDDSLSNKIICEAGVNSDKSNKTAYAYLKEKGGSIIDGIKLFTLEEYENHCVTYFKKNRTKLSNLLSEEVPEGFINRQLNDSRYISKLVKGLLGNIVRKENEKEAKPNNLVVVSGAITSKLKKDWGLNEQWNKILQPRFERLNSLTNSNNYGYLDYQKDKEGKNVGKQFFRLVAPDGVNKKRLDHRHHTLDAIVVACCTQDHVNYITSLETQRKNHKLVSKLCNLKTITRTRNGKVETIEVFDFYKKPWQDFTTDVLVALETTLVSFKKNTRVLTKTNNKTWQWVKDEKGNLKKQLVPQTKGDSRAIRKPLHTPLPYGKKNYDFTILEISKNLGRHKFVENKKIKKEIDLRLSQFDNKIGVTQKDIKRNPIKINGKTITHTLFNIKEERYRKRKSIYHLANRGKGGIKDLKKAIDFINKVSDRGLRNDLLRHLEYYLSDIDKAFSMDGIELFNLNRKIPVHKLPVSEASSAKFNIGKKNKYGESESGTNLFFAVYYNEETQTRVYDTIALQDVIEWQKWRVKNKAFKEPLIPINKELGTFLFSLSPNDLVFVPTQEEQDTPDALDVNRLSKHQVSRIYKMVSSDKKQCFFLQSQVSGLIENKNEFSASNKMEKSIDGMMIKSICWKLQVDRLGNITNIIK